MNDFLSRIGSVDESPPFLKFLIFGPPGTGKTVFASQAPNALLVDVERGRLSLRNHAETQNVKALPVRAPQDVEQLVMEARQGNLDEYETFIIDTLSELQSSDLTSRVKDKARKDASRSEFNATFAEYKENTEFLRRLIIALIDLDKHIILITHDKEDKDDNTGRVSIRPSLTPKLADTVKGLMDVQGYYTLHRDKAGTETRRLQLQPGNNVEVKCRLGGFPPVMDNPNIKELFSIAGKATNNE